MFLLDFHRQALLWGIGLLSLRRGNDCCKCKDDSQMADACGHCSAPAGASAISVLVAKKCNALLAEAFPPRQPGNPAASSAKGSGPDQGNYFKKCVDNNGNIDNGADTSGAPDRSDGALSLLGMQPRSGISRALRLALNRSTGLDDDPQPTRSQVRSEKAAA
jgi:hypothetical protein